MYAEIAFCWACFWFSPILSRSYLIVLCLNFIDMVIQDAIALFEGVEVNDID
ncbi:hypothetical protein APA_905 [Pseudanabaena sp. lw0831]|nr:hypothetical protein APA_905 [Pseudanabaena sp. lw0831]